MVGSSRMTFVAEFVDRLTGPSKKAQKAVEDLGKATAESSKRTAKANRDAEAAEKDRASTAKKTASVVERAEGRKQKATEDAGRTVQRVGRNTYAEWQREQRAAKEAATATVRAEQRKKRASQTTAQAIQNHGRRVTTTLGGTQTAANRTASAVQQMAGRSNRAVSGMQRGMDRINPGRMASRYNSALGRMLSRTEQVSGKIQGHLDKISSSGAVRGAQVGATVVGGMALAGGAKRIADVQQADVVMQTMGLNEQDRGKLIGQYKGLAQNTPYSTGSISMLGSGLLSAGMSQDDLQGALKGAIDTGALYGMDLEDIGLPLKQIQAKGKLQGDDVNQLVDRGIPIYKWIAEQKGVDQSKIPDMVTKGQVSSDDVFKALAKNSEGGAEKAAGTLKGSATNFKSSVSQAGEAFLAPMTDDLTAFLRESKNVVSELKPGLSMLGEFAGTAIHVLTPALPVLIPLVTGLGGGLLAVAAAAKAALIVKSLATGLGLIAQFAGGRGKGRGATGAVGLFTEFLGGMKDGAREAYGQRGLGGLNTGLDTTTKKMGKAQGAAAGFTKVLGGIAGAAAGLSMVGQGLNAVDPDKSLTAGSVGNSMAGGGSGGSLDALNKQVSGADWANGNSGKLKSSMFGSMEGINNVGDLVNRVANPGKVEGFQNKLNTTFGYENDYLSQGKRSVETIDSQLAGKVQAGDLAGAGSLFNQIAFQTETAGGSQQDAMRMFPQYKDAVYGVFTKRGQQVDDNAVLAAMRSDKGFRGGGYTGDGASTAFAGPAHRGEFYTNAEQTRRIGVPRLKEFVRTGGVGSPVVSSGDTTNVQVSVHAPGATVEGAQAVGESVEQAFQRLMEKERRRSANRHGTRELRGAH